MAPEKSGKGGADPFKKIYAVVKRIPEGRVATYGQVASLAGLPGRARLAGTALRDGSTWSASGGTRTLGLPGGGAPEGGSPERAPPGHECPGYVKQPAEAD